MADLPTITWTAGVPDTGQTGTVMTVSQILGTGPKTLTDVVSSLTDKSQFSKITNGTNTLTVDAHGSAQTTILDASGSAVSFNAPGAAVSASSDPVVIATDQATISTAPDILHLANGVTGTMLTLHRAAIACSSAGANTIITPTSGKKVLVVQWIVTVNAAVNFKWQTQTGSVDLTGLFYAGGQGGGAGGGYDPTGHFQTSTNSDTLILNLSGAVAVGGYLNYVEI